MDKFKLFKWPEGKDVRISIKDPQGETFRMEAIPKIQESDCPLCKTNPLTGKTETWAERYGSGARMLDGTNLDIEDGHSYMPLSWDKAEIRAFVNAIKYTAPRHNPRKNKGKVSYHLRIQKKWDHKINTKTAIPELKVVVLSEKTMNSIKQLTSGSRQHGKSRLRQRLLRHQLSQASQKV